MPVDEKKMKALKSEYGGKHGEKVYFAMENSGKKNSKSKKTKSSKAPAKGSKY
jgi:hypothetical protein